ncbi:hypothetical protein TorRG33x02_090990, partial [Trema orientale]
TLSFYLGKENLFVFLTKKKELVPILWLVFFFHLFRPFTTGRAREAPLSLTLVPEAARIICQQMPIRPSRWHEREQQLCSDTHGARHPDHYQPLSQHQPEGEQPIRGACQHPCTSTLCQNGFPLETQ